MTQHTRVIPSFTLESGAVLQDVSVAFQTWGVLNTARDNVAVVCHALTGNAAADDWWEGLFGPGRVLDPDRHFIVCANVLGSCYGTTGPVTINPVSGHPYGADFPEVTIRDTVRLHRHLLDALNIRGVDFAIGGSMGGMQVLEWALLGNYVRRLVPIAVGAHHSAWCVGWSEAQRQAIFADPKWQGGRYDPLDPPATGLAAARMAAMISYRSQSSFEARFGREKISVNGRAEPVFSVESYLRYQGRKLVDRFDANTYVGLTYQMDSHDVARGRGTEAEVLRRIHQPALVVGITSDVLYPLEEQRALVARLPNAELAVIESGQGHDAFLIEFDQMNETIGNWLEHTKEPRTHTP